MRVLESAPDGGDTSGVRAFFLFESKRFGSIALLRFNKGSRDAFHSHAFNALTWWLWGEVLERCIRPYSKQWWRPSLIPKFTPRNCFHKIEALRTTWALTFRGPWVDTWYEDRGGKLIQLTHGRKEVPL